MKELSLHILLFLSVAALASAATPTSQQWPIELFKSSPLQSPVMNVTKNGKTQPGYIFLSPTDMLRHHGFPAIYTDDGELIWQGPSGNITGFQPQTLNGESVLTYWNGTISMLGFGYGSIHFLNQEYQEIHRVTLSDDKWNFKSALGPQFPSYIDVHEDAVTDRGSVLVTAYNVTPADLQGLGGPNNGWVHDSQFYEIEIASNKVLFSWSALDHLNLTDSATPLYGTGHNQSNPWDFAHLNSVMRYGDEYIISSHGYCSIYAIDLKGNIKWTLNGRTGGDFQLAQDTKFCFQHDVRVESQTDKTITIRMHNNDNALFSKGTVITTGLLVDLNLDTKTASLNRRLWDADEPVSAGSQGSYQNLTNGHVFLGHGSVPKLEEYDETGGVVMRARFGYDNIMMSYRAFRAAWDGKPTTKPSVYACIARSSAGVEQVRVYASWNGATDVQTWEVYFGAKKEKLQKATTAGYNGFETEIRLQTSSNYALVKAIQSSGSTQSEAVQIESC
ncbi:hypothetical protein PEBR_12198 [Penicillium brasilianum]|uniref:Arylsulfotransferase n=1 Tax=Penicillium brasilianum TaxID=104259 RepID=A0A1S9RSG8_PENBI|nr:hypothetical protein PEBR_12198 [Penicillium brasilianum]